jgi:hypothetical protein
MPYKEPYNQKPKKKKKKLGNRIECTCMVNENLHEECVCSG